MAGRAQPRVEELREQVGASRPRCEAALPSAGRRAEAVRVLRPQVPAAGPWNGLRSRPHPVWLHQGVGGRGGGGPPRWAAEPAALSPDWEWAGPVPSGPQFPRPRSGDRRLHLPGRLC